MWMGSIVSESVLCHHQESSDLVTGHCDNNNFPCAAVLSPNNPLRHGADTQETGEEWRESANERGELDRVTNQRGWCTYGNYGWISDNIPSYTPLSNINIVWTVVKLLQLPRSLGINKAGRCPQLREMNGQWNWTMVVITPVYIKHREQLESIVASVILIGDKISCNYRVRGQRLTNDLWMGGRGQAAPGEQCVSHTRHYHYDHYH